MDWKDWYQPPDWRDVWKEMQSNIPQDDTEDEDLVLRNHRDRYRREQEHE